MTPISTAPGVLGEFPCTLSILREPQNPNAEGLFVFQSLWLDENHEAEGYWFWTRVAGLKAPGILDRWPWPEEVTDLGIIALPQDFRDNSVAPWPESLAVFPRLPAHPYLFP